MKKIRVFQIILSCVLLAASFSSCKKFLDTTAPLQVTPSVVFNSEQGFQQAVNAVYLNMGSNWLYGRELTTGLLSVLGRSYDTTIRPQVGNLYYQGAAYNFQDPNVSGVIRSIWDSTYICIAGLNNMLAQIDAKKALFTGNDYYDLKAEATALRAYLHFDLLRLFGPAVPSQNLVVPAIPYIKQLSPYAQPVLTTGAVFDSCVADLNTAVTLFKDSTVVPGHLNYWATRALQARLFLYEGDLADAKTCALDLINSRKFPLSTSNTDAMFSSELVFSLDVYNTNFLSYIRSVFYNATPMGLMPANQTILYAKGSGTTNDWRKSAAFLDPGTNLTYNFTNANAVVTPKKFSTNTIGTNNVMPMIRMTEMYYIAAECAQQLDGNFGQATAWLDSVRVHRGLTSYTLAALPHDSITTEIMTEYRKEMLGEGQVFYYFKRNNLNINTLPLQKVAPVSGASYVFPRPE